MVILEEATKVSVNDEHLEVLMKVCGVGGVVAIFVCSVWIG